MFVDIIPATPYKILTTDTTFSNYLLIVDTYSKIAKLYGMENITTEEFMEKIDMFQARFGKVYELFWWDMDRIQTMMACSLSPKSSSKVFLYVKDNYH